MNWYKKNIISQKQWTTNDLIEMIGETFKLLDHPKGPFVQWTEPYLGKVSFMNKNKDIRIELLFNIYFLSNIEVIISVLTRDGKLGSIIKKWPIKEFKQVPYNIVKNIYNIIDNPETDFNGENEDFIEPDLSPSPISPALITAKKIKTSSTEKELKQIGVEVENGIATLYRGTNIPNLIQEDLRYGDFLSSVPSGTDMTGNAGADAYGKYVVKYEIPIKNIEITNGELQYKGHSYSLEEGRKYPIQIYKAFNDYHGSNYTAYEIDKMNYEEIRGAASMALSGGRDEFDMLMSKHKI